MPVQVRPYKGGKKPGVWEVHIRGYFPDQVLYEDKKRSELTKKRAEQWGLQRELWILSLGSDGWKEKKDLKENPLLTVAQYAPAWLADYHKTNKKALATMLHRKSVLENHIVPLLGEKLLREIDDLDVQRLKKKMAELSVHHINGALVTLRLLLAGAKAEGQRDTDPPQMKFLPRPKAESLWFIPEDFACLVHHTQDQMVKAFILLGGDAGLRMGEMLGLEWSAVDFTRSQIEIKRAVSRGEERGPKWDSYRVVEMTQRLQEALRALPKAGAKVLRPVGALAFRRGESKGKAVSTKKLAYELLLAEEKAGLTRRGRLHMLRHTFGARLAMAGATVKEIATLMGHKNLKTTEIYMHLCPKLKGRAIGLLEVGDRVETAQEGKANSLKLL